MSTLTAEGLSNKPHTKRVLTQTNYTAYIIDNHGTITTGSFQLNYLASGQLSGAIQFGSDPIVELSGSILATQTALVFDLSSVSDAPNLSIELVQANYYTGEETLGGQLLIFNQNQPTTVMGIYVVPQK